MRLEKPIYSVVALKMHGNRSKIKYKSDKPPMCRSSVTDVL